VTHPNLKGWKVSCVLNYLTTPHELFINGISADSKEKLPKVSSKRVSLVQITRESLALERLDPFASDSIVICFENEDDLEEFQPLSLFPTKTKPEITGLPYFQAEIEISYPHGYGSGALLMYSNHLTRVLILGPELATNYEEVGATDVKTAQQWIKDNLSSNI
tara:strand:+ start:4590 stop:5078 length:489 start_codon:yes stop_codon:yes gene_type:complete